MSRIFPAEGSTGARRPGGVARAMKVREIMSAPVVSAQKEMPIREVAELLAQHRISAVPVIDGAGAVVGVVSEYDLLAKPGKVAADIMSSSVISVSEDTDVEDVRILLIDRRIHRVPVLSGQELVGIVSRGDIVALMAMEWICEVCGEAVRGERPPPRCPKCEAPGARFHFQEQLPGD